MGFAYQLGRGFFRVVFSTYFRWHCFNRERVPLAGPVILASNHASYIDPPLVGAPLARPLVYLARDTLFRFPLSSVLRAWNVVPVDRDGGGAAGLRSILEALRENHAVIVFPEGTRTKDGHLRSARSGIGLMVLKSAAPVIPVRVFGTFEAYGRHMRAPLPKPVAVKYGRPLGFEQLRAEAASCSKTRLKEIYQEIADQIMAAIGALEPWAEVERFAD